MPRVNPTSLVTLQARGLQSAGTGPRRHPTGFSLVELLVVIGIIALLIGILVPIASTIRTNAQTASTKALIRAMENAAQSYYTEFQQYPGILPDSELGPGTATTIDLPAGSGRYVNDGQNLLNTNPNGGISGAENFLLSTLGGLRLDGTDIVFDPERVGRGAVDLSGGGQAFPVFLDLPGDRLSTRIVSAEDIARFSSHFETADAGRFTGRFFDDSAIAFDSEVPEVVDAYSNPLPILYARANRRTGRTSPLAAADPSVRSTYYANALTSYTEPLIGTGREVVSDPADLATPDVQHHGLQVGDTSGSPPESNDGNVGDTVDTNGYNDLTQPGPYDLDVFLGRNGADAEPVNKDSFVLISAGPDRVYGTKDDIANFELPE